MRYVSEAITIAVCTVAVLFSFMIYLADQGRPAPGSYSDADRHGLNWLAMKHTRHINGKYQGRLGE